MATRDDVFPSRYLKAVDLKGRPVVLEIKNAQQETMTGFDGRQEQKTVLYFNGTQKKLPVNKTNWNAIVDVTGETDSDRWPGHKIEVYPSTTEMNGQTLPCIRVRSPLVRPAGARTLPKTDAAAARSDAADDLDIRDEIPF